MTESDKRARYTLRLPNELLEKIKSESDNQGVSSNALILQILWEWVNRNEKTV